MPRNPSELQRIHEDALSDERRVLLTCITHNRIAPSPTYADKGFKAAKEAMLRRVRAIEAELGIEGVSYNRTAFGKQD